MGRRQVEGPRHPAVLLRCVTVGAGPVDSAWFIPVRWEDGDTSSLSGRCYWSLLQVALGIACFYPLCLELAAQLRALVLPKSESPHLPCGFGKVLLHLGAAASSLLP